MSLFEYEPVKVDGVVKVIGPKNKREKFAINVCSHSENWSKGLSPFILGPVKLYDTYSSNIMENGWQYTKVYPSYAEKNGNPKPEYFEWALRGWNLLNPVRYPMGKGAKPLYCLWDGERLGYLEARKRVYLPLYRDAVRESEAFGRLQKIFESRGEITLFDFDGYDYLAMGYRLADVLEDDVRICGHGFILAMMLKYGPNFTVDDVLRGAF